MNKEVVEQQDNVVTTKDKYNRVIKRSIILCWIALAICFIVKIFGGNFFEIATTNQQFIKLCNFIDNNCLRLVQFINYYLISIIYFSATYRVIRLKLKDFLILSGSIVALFILKVINIYIGSAADNYVLASDFATIQRQLSNGFGDLTSQTRFIQNGLCDGFYAMNTGMLNGFAGVNSAITTSGYETRNAISNLGSQLAGCCCDLKGGIKDTQYAIAMQTNSIQQALCTGFRDVIDSQNANYRALHDEIVANRIEDKNAQIAAQQNEINRLQLSASQSAQNAYLLSELKACPKPSYIVPNPNCCYNYGVTPTGTCGAVV